MTESEESAKLNHYLAKEEVGDNYAKWEPPNVSKGNRKVPLAKNEETFELTKSQLEEIKKSGYEEGYTSGYAKGFASGEAEIQQQIQAIKTILTNLQEPIDNLENETINKLVSMLVKIAESVIHAELSLNNNLIVNIFTQALASLPAYSGEITVYLNPEDIEIITEHLADFEYKNINIKAETELAAGGCKLVTKHSETDASLETRINSIVTSVLDEQLEPK
jgi:flagellar assembly protein FliH